MHFVYILESADGHHWYTGTTNDIQRRLAEHNAGKSPHTSKHAQWRLKSYHAFASEQHAVQFEKYLKSHSGRTFAKKHFFNYPNVSTCSLQAGDARSWSSPEGSGRSCYEVKRAESNDGRACLLWREYLTLWHASFIEKDSHPHERCSLTSPAFRTNSASRKSCLYERRWSPFCTTNEEVTV